MVGAGVGEHSVYKTDPWGRLYRSLDSLMTQIYGSQSAVAEGERLRELHQQIKGVDAQGRRYSALNPEAFYWVHATVLEGALVFQERFDRPLSPDELDRIYDEWRRVGLMLGLRERDLPTDIAGFWRRWDEIKAKLENNPVVQDVLHNGPKRPFWLPLTQRRFDALNRPTMKLQRDVTTWTLDDDLREKFGLPVLTRAEVRRLRRLAWLTRLLGRVLPDPAALPAPHLHRPPTGDGPHRPPAAARRLSTDAPGDPMTALETRPCPDDHERPARLGHRRGARPAHRPGVPRVGRGLGPAAPRRAVRRPGHRHDPDEHRRRRDPRRRRGPRRCRRLGRALVRRPRRGDAALPRPVRRAPGRGHRPDPVGDGQGPLLGLAGDPPGRQHRPPLRPRRREVPLPHARSEVPCRV